MHAYLGIVLKRICRDRTTRLCSHNHLQVPIVFPQRFLASFLTQSLLSAPGHTGKHVKDIESQRTGSLKSHPVLHGAGQLVTVCLFGWLVFNLTQIAYPIQPTPNFYVSYEIKSYRFIKSLSLTEQYFSKFSIFFCSFVR